MSFENASILITGGTGSLGKKLTKTLLDQHNPRRVVIFSRDEMKQVMMQQMFPQKKYPCLRYFIGDVRDQERLMEVCLGIDYIIHAAAIKHVPVAEYNPFEAIKTNVLGGQNVIQAAIKCGVKRVVALSTDKAANPLNLYGATKLCSDKLFIAGNSMSSRTGTAFSVVRYGNVMGSNGSVFPLFMKLKDTGVLPITDENMTRFSITIEEGANFVLSCLDKMIGGELFVPKLPSYRIVDVAKAIAPAAKIEVVGIRPGEKMHEAMIPLDEARMTLEFDKYFIIQPAFHWWASEDLYKERGGVPCSDDFCYSSDLNDKWLTVEEIRSLIEITRNDFGL